MDPHLQTILDEIKGLSASMVDLKTSVTERIDGVEHALDDRFKRIEAAAGKFGDWKPKVDASIDDLYLVGSDAQDGESCGARFHSECFGWSPRHAKFGRGNTYCR